MNILLIGLGSVGRKHLDTILKFYPTSNIFALRSNINCKIYPYVTNINDFENINFQLDFIIISNPTFLHEEYILKSVKFDCPLFIEKPVLHSLENSSGIKNIINNHKIRTYIACNMRFHPCILYLKNFVNLNLNKVYEVNIYFGSYLPNWRKGVDYRQIYSSHSDMGGGVHLDLIHEIDYCIWIFGKPKSIKKTFRKVSILEINSYDYTNYLLLYDNFTINIILNYYRKDAKRNIEVLTNQNTLNFDLISNKISDDKNNIIYQKNFSLVETYEDQMKYFVESIKKGTLLMNNFDESIEILKYALHD